MGYHGKAWDNEIPSREEGIDPRTLQNLRHNKKITMLTAEKLCRILNCGISDIVEFVDDRSNFLTAKGCWLICRYVHKMQIILRWSWSKAWGKVWDEEIRWKATILTNDSDTPGRLRIILPAGGIFFVLKIIASKDQIVYDKPVAINSNICNLSCAMDYPRSKAGGNRMSQECAVFVISIKTVKTKQSQDIL